MLKVILLPCLLLCSSQIEQGQSTPSPTQNVAPRVVGSIDNHVAIAEEAFSFTPPSVFDDDDPLTYSASTPSFLSFNREIQQFYGTPQGDDIDSYNISLTATDTGGLSATTYFLLEVVGGDDASNVEEEDSVGGFAAACSAFGCVVVYGFVDAIQYARWRMKKKMQEEEEEEEDASHALLSCEHYRSECCKGHFKFLSCYNKCTCCDRLFACMCDTCCTGCCSECSCNCCQTQTNPSSLREDSYTPPTTKALTIGNITGNNGPITIDNSNKIDNTSHTNITNHHDHRSFVTNNQTIQIIQSPSSEEEQEKRKLDIATRKAWFDACEKGDVELVKAIYEKHRVDVNEKDKDGQTPLHLAAKKGHAEVVRMLFAFKADVSEKDAQGESPLHGAAEKGHPQVARMLITKLNADVNEQDNDGWTPLHWAARHGDTAFVRMLISEFKAKVDPPTKQKGSTPLHVAAENGHPKVARLLIMEFKADLSAKDNKGKTPLHKAAIYGQPAIVKLFIDEFNPDLNARDNEGRTPLHRAAEKGTTKVVKLLVDAGADVNRKDKGGYTPLERAAEKGYYSQLEAFLKR